MRSGSQDSLPRWTTLPEPAPSTASPASSTRDENEYDHNDDDDDEAEVVRAALNGSSPTRQLVASTSASASVSAPAPVGPSNSRKRKSYFDDTTDSEDGMDVDARGRAAASSLRTGAGAGGMRGQGQSSRQDPLVAALNASSAHNHAPNASASSAFPTSPQTQNPILPSQPIASTSKTPASTTASSTSTVKPTNPAPGSTSASPVVPAPRFTLLDATVSSLARPRGRTSTGQTMRVKHTEAEKARQRSSSAESSEDRARNHAAQSGGGRGRGRGRGRGGRKSTGRMGGGREGGRREREREGTPSKRLRIYLSGDEEPEPPASTQRMNKGKEREREPDRQLDKPIDKGKAPATATDITTLQGPTPVQVQVQVQRKTPDPVNSPEKDREKDQDETATGGKKNKGKGKEREAEVSPREGRPSERDLYDTLSRDAIPLGRDKQKERVKQIDRHKEKEKERREYTRTTQSGSGSLNLPSGIPKSPRKVTPRHPQNTSSTTSSSARPTKKPPSNPGASSSASKSKSKSQSISAPIPKSRGRKAPGSGPGAGPSTSDEVIEISDSDEEEERRPVPVIRAPVPRRLQGSSSAAKGTGAGASARVSWNRMDALLDGESDANVSKSTTNRTRKSLSSAKDTQNKGEGSSSKNKTPPNKDRTVIDLCSDEDEDMPPPPPPPAPTQAQARAQSQSQAQAKGKAPEREQRARTPDLPIMIVDSDSSPFPSAPLAPEPEPGYGYESPSLPPALSPPSIPPARPADLGASLSDTRSSPEPFEDDPRDVDMQEEPRQDAGASAVAPVPISPTRASAAQIPVVAPEQEDISMEQGSKEIGAPNAASQMNQKAALSPVGSPPTRLDAQRSSSPEGQFLAGNEEAQTAPLPKQLPKLPQLDISGIQKTTAARTASASSSPPTEEGRRAQSSSASSSGKTSASPAPMPRQPTRSTFIDFANPPDSKMKNASPLVAGGRGSALGSTTPTSPARLRYMDLGAREYRRHHNMRSVERRKTLGAQALTSPGPDTQRHASLSSSSSAEQSERMTPSVARLTGTVSTPALAPSALQKSPIRSPIAPQLGAQPSPSRSASTSRLASSTAPVSGTSSLRGLSGISSKPLQFKSNKLSERTMAAPSSSNDLRARGQPAAAAIGAVALSSPSARKADFTVARTPTKMAASRSLDHVAPVSSPVLPAVTPPHFGTSPPVSSPEPEGAQPAEEDGVEEAPEVEAVSSQIDQMLSLDPAPQLTRTDDEGLMDVDVSRREADEDFIVPESPQPEREDDDDDGSVLEYASDPDPPVYTPEPVKRPVEAAAAIPVERPATSEALSAPESRSETPASQDSILDNPALDDREKEELLIKRTRYASEESDWSSSSSIHPPSLYHSEPSATPEEAQPCRPAQPVQLLNFQQYRLDYRLPVHYARDLPHTTQDHVNSLPQSYRNKAHLRFCFESMMAENTAGDEPDAPKIRLINNVDNESTPPWEFHYSNHMWLGNGVPTPNVKKLKGCDCIGGCNPKSRSCSCLKQQRELYIDNTYPDFAYNKDGKLLYHHDDHRYAIFECNEMCGCDETCRNRVVQNGRKYEINIVKTPKKGWGVFAGDKVKIPKGSYIGIYAGEVINEAEAELRGQVYNDKGGRSYLFDLDSYHLRYVTEEGDLQNQEERDASDKLAEAAEAAKAAGAAEAAEAAEAGEAGEAGENKENKWTSKYSIDAFHAGNFTRYVNHSCQPNCELFSIYTNNPNLNLPLLVFFTIRDIDRREELTFDYAGESSTEKGKKKLNNNVCHCGAASCRGYMFG